MKRTINMIFYFSAFILLVGGCAQDENKEMPDSIEKEQPGTLKITENNVAGLDGSTLFDSLKIKDLVGNYAVVKDTESIEGMDFPVFKVMENENVLLRITPTRNNKTVSAIEILNSKVKNELGPQIGDKYNDLLGRNLVIDLKPGIEEMSGKVIGRAFGSDHVSYVFSGSFDGPDGEIPPLEVFQNWKITEILWKK